MEVCIPLVGKLRGENPKSLCPKIKAGDACRKNIWRNPENLYAGDYCRLWTIARYQLLKFVAKLGY
jgi:hypothetical protein